MVFCQKELQTDAHKHCTPTYACTSNSCRAQSDASTGTQNHVLPTAHISPVAAAPAVVVVVAVVALRLPG
jgi:hypothetical protein